MDKFEYSFYLDEILQKEGMDEGSANKLIKHLNKEKDHRQLRSDLFTALCDENGALHQFIVKVKEANAASLSCDKLVMCFRRDKLKIYRNNHVVWDISKNGDAYAVEFDFNHARYCKEWKAIWATLQDDYGFIANYTESESKKVVDSETGLKPQYRKNTNLVTGGDIGTIRCVKKSFSKEFVDGTCTFFSKLIDSFMQEGEDQFRKEMRILAEDKSKGIVMAEKIHEQGSNPYIEKRWQQRLFTLFKEKYDNQSWIFVYDLEFSQAYPDNPIKEKMEANEPDMMAIQFSANGIAEKLLLIEVKSTYNVCWNVKKNKKTGKEEHKSDLWEHVKGMKAYTDMHFFIRSRIIDAYQMMTQYSGMGLFPAVEATDLESILALSDDDVKRIILMTNNTLPKDEEEKVIDKKRSAIDFLNEDGMSAKMKEMLTEQDPECEVWVTHNNYFDEDIKINYNYQL